MKLSCIPVSLYEDIFSGKRSVINWIHFAATLGLEGVDFSVKFFPSRDEDTLNAIIEEGQKIGIEFCALACYPDFTHPDADQRALEIEQMKVDVQLTATLGAKYARVTAGQNHPGTDRTHGIRWAVDGLRQVLDEADKLGSNLSLRKSYQRRTLALLGLLTTQRYFLGNSQQPFGYLSQGLF